MSKTKQEKRKYSGFPGDCSVEQINSLSKFKQIVKNHNSGQLQSNWDDFYLLRFLRARKFHLGNTEKMWVDFIEWRRKNHIDQIANHYFFPQLSDLRKVYPHGYHKFDKRYRPIYIQRLGFTSPEQIFKFTTPERLLNYYAMLYETLLTTIFDACTLQKKKQTGDGSRVIQTCTILDLTDIKITAASSAYKFVKPASEMAQNNYPEILGKSMFIINAPFLFTGIWAIVKMWIDEKTKEKIQIFGSNYKNDLLKYIDAQNLPDFIDGGTCKCKEGNCLVQSIGPWNPEGKQFYSQCFEENISNKVQKQAQLIQKK